MGICIKTIWYSASSLNDTDNVGACFRAWIFVCFVSLLIQIPRCLVKARRYNPEFKQWFKCIGRAIRSSIPFRFPEQRLLVYWIHDTLFANAFDRKCSINTIELEWISRNELGSVFATQLPMRIGWGRFEKTNNQFSRFFLFESLFQLSTFFRAS